MEGGLGISDGGGVADFLTLAIPSDGMAKLPRRL